MSANAIVPGCVLLSWAEISEAASKPDVSLVWTAIIASMATGIGAALAATASRTLALAGWSPGSVLAHLTIAAALIWLPMQGEIAVPDIGTLSVIGLIGAVAVLLPLLLLQIALRRVDALTVLIRVAAQPVLSFLFALPSPAYD